MSIYAFTFCLVGVGAFLLFAAWAGPADTNKMFESKSSLRRLYERFKQASTGRAQGRM